MEVCVFHRTHFLLIYLFQSKVIFFCLLPEILTQRFTARFLNSEGTNAAEPLGNPGINILVCLLKVKRKKSALYRLPVVMFYIPFVILYVAGPHHSVLLHCQLE